MNIRVMPDPILEKQLENDSAKFISAVLLNLSNFLFFVCFQFSLWAYNISGMALS